MTPQEVMSRHARSFAPAARLLPRATARASRGFMRCAALSMIWPIRSAAPKFSALDAACA